MINNFKHIFSMVHAIASGCRRLVLLVFYLEVKKIPELMRVVIWEAWHQRILIDAIQVMTWVIRENKGKKLE